MHRFLLLSALVVCLDAAEFHMRDGQVLFGEIVGRGAVGGAPVVMARLGDDTAVVILKAGDIAEISDGIAKEAAPADAGLVTAAQYAEIPVRGRFGQEVFADALVAGVARAHQLGIRHVVFTIDSAGWNDIDEARTVFRRLSGFRNSLTLHALVKACRGDALAVLLTCDSVHLLPGAVIGGSEGGPADGDAIMRADVARLAGQAAAARGWPAAVFEGMIDPGLGLVAWKDADGRITVAAHAPADVPGERVVLSVPAGGTVVLDEAVLRQTRVPFVDGIAGIGTQLSLPGWSEGSTVPREVMVARATRERTARAADASRLQRQIEHVVGRRDAADAVLKEAVRQAAEWDPAKGDYSTYSYGWGWGDSKLLTNTSLAEWRMRSDYALAFLAKGVVAARELRTREAECEHLGVPRVYDEARLTAIIEDLIAKGTFIQTMRNKWEK